MTTSPEALREAVERLTAHAEFIGQPDAGVVMVAFPRHVVAADLTLVLTALQEAREALGPFEAVSAQDIGDDEQDRDAFKPMSSGNARAPLITVGSLRRAAEVYRALSPGGADE